MPKVRLLDCNGEELGRFKTLWQVYYFLIDQEEGFLKSTVVVSGCVSWWSDKFSDYWWTRGVAKQEGYRQ